MNLSALTRLTSRYRVRSDQWQKVAPHFLPFADAATTELPLGRLLRLSLFQVSVGMATVLMIGTLNRVMIVEMGMVAWLVSLMIALPLLFAPFRALVGFKSDTHRSVLGWKRVPYIWIGTWLQFGGLAIMPFALIHLSGDSRMGPWLGQAASALAFLLVGAGAQTTQTAGLALATDIAPERSRPRVVALMYVMLLVGMVVSSLIFGLLLSDFSNLRLIQVVQGAAAATMALNLIALWKQEARRPHETAPHLPRPDFRTTWNLFAQQGRTLRFLFAVGLGTAAFSMQDIILEPYGGEVLGMSVSATTVLTALMAAGALTAFGLAARWLSRGTDAGLLAACGAIVGLCAFAAVIFSAPLDSPALFRLGATLIGFGGGLFAVSTLTGAIALDGAGHVGLALGAWGAVQATGAGLGMALGGGLRDLVAGLSSHGLLGPALMDPSVAYSVVYHIEIALLFITLVAIGPLVRLSPNHAPRPSSKFGLAELPG
jgi:BCD family chlorophyll transporter-like MFS transporter